MFFMVLTVECICNYVHNVQSLMSMAEIINEHILLYMCLYEGVSDDNILESVNTRIKVRVYTCGS